MIKVFNRNSPEQASNAGENFASEVMFLPHHKFPSSKAQTTSCSRAPKKLKLSLSCSEMNQ
jgi:hypothetical protein